LNGYVDSKVEQNYSDDEETYEVSDLKVLHLVSKDKQGVARPQNAKLIKLLVQIRFPVLIGLELNYVDQVQL
jgi:hypothetical protein